MMSNFEAVKVTEPRRAVAAAATLRRSDRSRDLDRVRNSRLPLGGGDLGEVRPVRGRAHRRVPPRPGARLGVLRATPRRPRACRAECRARRPRAARGGGSRSRRRDTERRRSARSSRLAGDRRSARLAA